MSLSNNDSLLRRALQRTPPPCDARYGSLSGESLEAMIARRQAQLRGDLLASATSRVAWWWVLVAAVLLCAAFALWPSGARAAGCRSLPPQGAPVVTRSAAPYRGPTTEVCHDGYDALVADDIKIPLWVAYQLTGEHALGCLARKNNFHADPALPADGARPGDYAKTGYDKGHQAPAEDFAWSADEMSDSFSMANMAPQRPGLNRQQWERLEETARAWAWQRGPLSIYVGPYVGGGGKKIGRDEIAVPEGFWKVLVDRAGAALAFYKENRASPKGIHAPQLSSARVVAGMVAGYDLPVAETGAALWPADLRGYRAARARACRR